MILLQNPSCIIAQDYDIDPQTGFVPSIVPVSRLPVQWEAWESVLDDLKANRLKLGNKPNLSAEDTAKSEVWRSCVCEVCLSQHRFWD
jgi:indoleamine 2,3-dioxygenase